MQSPILTRRTEAPGAWPVWLRFVLICALLLSLAVWLEPNLGPLNRATSSLVGALLELWGEAPLVRGELVTLSGFTVRIVGECTSLYATLLLVSFVLATPATWGGRLAGMTAGGALIGALNLARIVLVIRTGAFHPSLFQAAHVFLGQVVMLAMVVGCSLAWKDRVEGNPWGIGFVARCLAWGALLFIPWLMLDVAYMKLLDAVVLRLFALEGYRLVIPLRHTVYYQTFNLVFLGALMLAEMRIALPQRLGWMARGAVLLVAGHLLFRVGNVMLTAFGWEEGGMATGIVSTIGGYLLPVGVWLAALRSPGSAPGGCR